MTRLRLVDAFRQRLRELGYVESRNISIEVRSVAQPEQFREVAAELVGLEWMSLSLRGPRPHGLRRRYEHDPNCHGKCGRRRQRRVREVPAPTGRGLTGQSFLGSAIGIKGLDLITGMLPACTAYRSTLQPGDCHRARRLTRCVPRRSPKAWRLSELTFAERMI